MLFSEVITMREYEDAYPEIFATFDDYEAPEGLAADVAMQRCEDVD